MSLLKVNEVQNYNGSSLTLTASTVSTSAQLNTGGNISVTGSINVSDDSTTRSNLGLGTIATQDSDSITVTGGTATLGALTVSGSDSGDLVRITQTGSGNALVVEDSANPDSTPFVVDASGNVGIGTSSPATRLHLEASNVKLRLQSGGGDDTTEINFFNGSNNQSKIDSRNDGITTNTGILRFYTQPNGGSVTERMRIDSSGDVQIGNDINLLSARLDVYTTSGTNASFRQAASSNAQNITVQHAWASGSNQAPQISFNNASFVQVGSIISTGTSTGYNTSSDYRLKTDLQPMTGATDRLKALKPVNFEWISTGSRVDGFIAHEVSDIVPEAVSGEKDAVNEDRSIRPQGLDLSKLVPLLTAALQESIAKIESLETRIAQLESK